MKKRTYTDKSNARLVELQGAREYLQMGRDKTLEICKKSGARINIGKSVRYDLRKIDEYLETLRGGANE